LICTHRGIEDNSFGIDCNQLLEREAPQDKEPYRKNFNDKSGRKENPKWIYRRFQLFVDIGECFFKYIRREF
jgi:hypothetical protein